MMIFCSVKSFKSHLLNKHLLFFISKTSTASPPWSLGLQMMFHWVSLYFLLWPLLSQKNLDLKRSSLFLSPLGISKNDSVNIATDWICPLKWSQTKFFCFSGQLDFYMSILTSQTPGSRMNLYRDLGVNLPFFSKSHLTTAPLLSTEHCPTCC
jgi:hypothetical protein